MLPFLVERFRKEFLTPPDAFDQRLGVETRRTIWRGRLSINEDSSGYEAVNPELFSRGIANVPHDVTFIDMGCGKGRGLILAHEAGFTDLIGVDMSGKLIRAARRNLERLKIPASLVVGDAAKYEFPAQPFVLFMYNPFGELTMWRVRENLWNRRYPVYVVYINPRQRGIFCNFRELYSEPGVAVWENGPEHF